MTQGFLQAALGRTRSGRRLASAALILARTRTGEWPGRDQEVVAGGIPIATVIGHAATGDEAMDMRMVDELLRPSVQHRHHADGAADVAPITGQLDDGLRGRLHERGVAVALVGAQHLAQLRRHGNRDVEIGARLAARPRAPRSSARSDPYGISGSCGSCRSGRSRPRCCSDCSATGARRARAFGRRECRRWHAGARAAPTRHAATDSRPRTGGRRQRVRPRPVRRDHRSVMSLSRVALSEARVGSVRCR